MPDHIGRRRRRSKIPTARLAVLALALAVVVRVLTLSEPSAAPTPASTPLTPVPVWTGPTPVDLPALLSDATPYQPRIYLTVDTSVGVAPTSDGRFLRVLLRQNGPAPADQRLVELRRVSVEDNPQFDGFAVVDDTVVWAESVSPSAGAFRTSLFRGNWHTAARATRITANGGAANFFGGQYDLVIHDGRVYWAALGGATSASTEVRSVRLSGGTVSTRKLTGAFALSVWPWAVSTTGGRGAPVELVNLDTGARMEVATDTTEVVACSPAWCRMGVLGDTALVRIDLQRPDGSQRRRVSGTEATPTITDVALLDRFIPLKTDYAEGNAALSLYDIENDRTDLVAIEVANIHALDSIVWWSTGFGTDMVWHAIDLRELS